VFVCYVDDFLDIQAHRWFPTKVADVAKWNPNPTLSDRAWCFEAPARGGYYQYCFMSLDECARRARLDPHSDGPCVQQDATIALAGADAMLMRSD